jgi:hypothetical protein
VSRAVPPRDPAPADGARADRRAGLLLALGALTGILAGALAGIGGSPGAALPPGAIALVNGSPILDSDYQRAVSMLAGDRRETPDAGERAHVLDRLIDEELLVQHALASGLAESDRVVRETVLRAMIDAAIADQASRRPSESELRALYQEASANRGEAGTLPPFETVRGQLEAAWTERTGAAALRAYVDGLRARATVTLAPRAGP